MAMAFGLGRVAVSTDSSLESPPPILPEGVHLMQIEGVSGVFRTRRSKDGSLHVWAPGWRLNLRFAPLIPPVLGIAFLASNLPLPMRLPFAAALMGCGVIVKRASLIGIVLASDEVRLIGIARTHRVKWEDVSGFIGVRDAYEGWPVLVTVGGEQLRAPGSLPSEAMDTYWDETEVSAIDQLNKIVEAFRQGELAPAVVPVPRRRPKRRETKSSGLPPSVVDVAPTVDTEPVRDTAPIEVLEPAGVAAPNMAMSGATRGSGTPQGVPAYVAAAEQRSAYPSRGAERLAEWERVHASAVEPESQPRRARRRHSS